MPTLRATVMLDLQVTVGEAAEVCEHVGVEGEVVEEVVSL